MGRLPVLFKLQRVGPGFCVWAQVVDWIGAINNIGSVWFVLVQKGPRTEFVISVFLEDQTCNIFKLSSRDQTCQVNITQGPKLYFY